MSPDKPPFVKEGSSNKPAMPPIPEGGMECRFRSLLFREPMSLPGRTNAEYAHQFDPENPSQGGFEMTFSEYPVPSVKIRVPAALRKRGAGAWVDPTTRNGNYGLGAVVRVPMTAIKKYELVSDFEEDQK